MSAEIVHRLGVLGCGAMALGWLVRAFGRARYERRVRRRLAGLLDPRRAPHRRRFDVRGAGLRWLPPVGAVCRRLGAGRRGGRGRDGAGRRARDPSVALAGAGRGRWRSTT